MAKMLVFLALGVCCSSLRAAAAELVCGAAYNPVCAVYRVCRQALELYPGTGRGGQGKECVLTVAGRRIIIRRRLVNGEGRYFFYLKAGANGQKKNRPGRGSLTLPVRSGKVRDGPRRAGKKAPKNGKNLIRKNGTRQKRKG